MTQLIEPERDEEILDWDEESLRLNAVMTGDVFADVLVESASATLMVAGHPCTIRGGNARLLSRIPCIRIVERQWLPYNRWPTGHWNYFPIAPAAGLGTVAASLLDWVTVDGDSLVRERRRMTLTEYGVVVFQQRLVHALTRFALPKPELEEAMRAVLREAEFERDWVTALEEQADWDTLIADFDGFMRDENRRERLKDRSLESAIRRELNAELRRRCQT